MSIILTRYLYPKESVLSSLVWAVLDQHSEEALFWAYELYYSGFKQDVFDLLISIHIVFYHEKYPQQTDILYPLLEKWHNQEKAQNKKFRHHDTILGSVLMNIMYYQTPSDVEYTKHLYTCSLSQLMRKRAGVNYIETVYEKQDGSDSNHPIEFTLHELRPYQTIYTKPPSVILRDACKFPIRNIGCDVRDHNKYVMEEGERSDVYEMALRYLKIPMYAMTIQELQDKWLYYASHSPIWAKRITDYHGEIDHEHESVKFDNDVVIGDDEEQFYQEFQYEPDEQSITVHKSIGIDVSHMTMSWLDFYNKYSKDDAIRSVKIRIYI